MLNMGRSETILLNWGIITKIIWGEEAGGGLTAHCHHYYPPPVFATVQCWAANGSVGYIESFAHRSRPQAWGISGFFDMIIMVIIMIMIIIMMIAIRDNDRHTSTTFLCYILPKNIVDWVHKCFCIVEKTFCDILQRYTTRCIHPTFFCIDRLLYKVTQNAQKPLTESSSPNIFWVFFLLLNSLSPLQIFWDQFFSTELALAPSNSF